ncbi:MAG: T9SS type A sorting domain-containing protein [Bacteroidales bacterium]|nr:T9SS type A sorting domain-containing protein [Bacteroidales bacterium]
MKKIILFIVFIVFANISFSQAWLDNLPRTKTTKQLTLFDYQKAFNNYWAKYNVKNGKYLKDGELVKAPGWKQFKRWEYYWESRVNASTGEFPNTTTADEMLKFKSSTTNLKSQSGAWTNLGTNSSSGGYAGIGRINCIAFHPSDNNTFWVGAPSGGIWKTTNGGSSWTCQSDNNPVLGVSAIAVSPNFASDNTLYIATGDRDGGSSWSLGGDNYNDNNSVGVLKSTDGGSTWAATTLSISVSSSNLIGALIIHPSNPAILYAGLNDGIYKTVDNGATWSRVYNTGEYVIDLEFNPGDPNTIYACTKDRWGYYPEIFRTIDGGSSWTLEYTGASSDTRIELAVGAYSGTTNDNIVYAAVVNSSGGLTGIYKSTDSGDNFSMVFDGSTKSLFGYYSDGSGSNTGQGNYDIVLAVNPENVNTLFVGGINTWKSTDGGVNWTNNNMWTSSGTYNFISSPVVHADKHCLKYQNASTLFEGNDGGIYRTTTGGTSWTDLSNGLVISQIYRIGVSQNYSNSMITGLQDNGSKIIYYGDGNWYDIKGGDGMECIIDYTDDATQYATYVNGQITRTTDYWSNTTDINENIGDGTLEGAWVTPYIIDPTNHNTIYVGYADVWKSTDNGDNFTQISTMNSSDNLRSMAIAPSDNQTIYVADQSNIWRTTNGGTNWTNITGSLPTVTNSITYIAVHATNPQTIWLTMGGYNSYKVYKSADGGSSWTNISAGLPNIPVYSIVHDKATTDNDVLYVGTDVGVYCKPGDANWTPFNTGLPNVMVTELEIYYAADHNNSKLRAATYGRGLWESDLAGATTGIDDLTNLNKLGITIYPNPTNGIINISSIENLKNVEIKVIDISGKIVFSKKYENLSKETIDLTYLSKNVYILQLETNMEMINSKFILK